MSIDTNCEICQENVHPPLLPYICPETGRGANQGKVHPIYHKGCMQTWAKTKDAAGHKVICSFPGCETNISDLLPKPGYLRQAADFFKQRPSAVTLAVGLPLLGVNIIAGPAVSFGVGVCGFVRAIAAIGLERLGRLEVQTARLLAAAAAPVLTGLGGAIVASVTIGAAANSLELAIGMAAHAIIAIAGIDAAAAATLRGQEEPAPQARDFLSMGAATAGICGLSALINGGSMEAAAAAATVSAGGTYFGRKFPL